MEMQEHIYKDTGMVVAEKNISIHEIIQAHQENRLIEIIGCSMASHI
jgi:peroxiredoxin family protein